MGLNYSIKTYVKKQQISRSLNWLFEHTWVYDHVPQNIMINGELLKIKGNYFTINNRQNEVVEKATVIEHFQEIHFSVSLVFDIDPQIITAIPSWELKYRMDLLEDFKEQFEQVYLGDGKIRMGGFDTTISRLTHQDVYAIVFVAVTSGMSTMIENSVSVKKWILEFSKVSDSLLTYLDLEHNGHRLLFYNRNEVDVTIKEGFEIDSYESVKNMIFDYFKLEADWNIST